MRKELMEIEVIEQYLLGEMNADEKASFEQRLNSEPKFAALVLAQKEAMEGLERVGLKMDTQNGYRRYKVRRWATSIGVGLGLVLLGVGIWFFAFSEPEERGYCECNEVQTEGAGDYEYATYEEASIDTCPPSELEIEPILEEQDEPNDSSVYIMEESSEHVSYTDTIIEVNYHDEVSIIHQDELVEGHEGSQDNHDAIPIQPEFPGGRDAMLQFIQSNIRYPNNSFNKGIKGTVQVSFSVSAEGNLSNFDIYKSVNDELDTEAMRVVKKMPNWNPGKVDGQPTAMNFVLPIVFEIREQ